MLEVDEHGHRAGGRRALAPRRRARSSTSPSSASSRASACRASIRTSRAPPHARGEAAASLGDTKDDLPADDHAYALLPERRRAQGARRLARATRTSRRRCSSTSTSRSPAATPLDYATKYAAERRSPSTSSSSTRSTPAEMPRTNALYLDPRGPGSPFKVENEIVQPGFDKIDRKHPIVRFTALDQVNIARGHKLKPEPSDKVIGASRRRAHPGRRQPRRHTSSSRIGFDVRESDLPLRVAWPVLLLNIDQLLHRRGRRATSRASAPATCGASPSAPGRAAGDADAPRRRERSRCPVHEGRAVYLGQRAGFYELDDARSRRQRRRIPRTPKRRPDRRPSLTQAGNDRALRREPPRRHRERHRAGREAHRRRERRGHGGSAFHVGVRREIWIYLLIAAVADHRRSSGSTYHRRITV